MKNFNLSEFSYEELRALRDKIDKMLDNFKKNG